MEVKVPFSAVFEASEVDQASVVDALDVFGDKLKRLSVKLDAIYPGDPFALPFCMYLSDRLSVPIKTEIFLSKSDSVLIVFSVSPFNGVSEAYLSRKVEIFRRNFPRSPALLVLSDGLKEVDFQLIKAPIKRLFSYQFMREAAENYFWPTSGEVTTVSERLWELSKREIANFLKSRRIRNAARSYLKEEDVPRLKVTNPDVELSIWEKFKKGNLVRPECLEGQRKEEKIRVEKLFQVKTPLLASAVASLLEYVAQVLEFQFPTQLAYSNVEAVERKGILIIPKVSEEVNGADLRVEFVVNLDNPERNFAKVELLLRSAVKEIVGEIFGGNCFKPVIDSVFDAEAGKGSLYLSWFIDAEMAERVNSKVNRRWLFSRLFYRKKIKVEFSELLKMLREFEFNLENYTLLVGKISSLWRKNKNIFKAKSGEIVKAIDEKGMWPLVATLCFREPQVREPLLYLIKLKGYENFHHLLSELNVYHVPVLTKRIYRPNWERVIREKTKLFVKGEPLNPVSPITYVLQTEDGKPLGTIPKAVSHYLLAKERQGKRIECGELYFEPDVFSENSYWIEIRCL